MIAEIIAAGSEMLTPHRQDTNSLFLTQGLNDLGVAVAFKTIVGDNLEQLTDVARIALGRADLVLFSGGLGPTEDDLTREAVAGALGVGLRRDEELLAGLRKRFAERGYEMPPNNHKQADVLEGAVILPNRLGSAAGQMIEREFGGKRRIAMLLPGPPKELGPMFAEECRPRLRAMLPPKYLASRLLRMALLPESQVDARTAPIYQGYTDVETTILSGSGEIQLHFVCSKPTEEEARARVDELTGRIAKEMGDAVFATQGESLEGVVHDLLAERKLNLAAAESCTGGLLAQRLTAVPNSSQTFVGGAVTYTPELKHEFADVSLELIEREGAISEPVARAMAEGIRKRAGTSFGMSVTGLAGPGPGAPGPDEQKPIGLVYIGLASDKGTAVKELMIRGDRDHIRWWATQHGLDMVRRELLARP